MRALRLVAVHLRVVVLHEMQYRANLLFQVLQSAVALATGLAVLALVLSYTEEVNGWSGPQLIAVLGTFTIMGGIIRMVVRPNLVQFMEDVQKGTLDYLLIKPVDPQLLVSIRTMHLWQGFDILIGSGLLIYASVQLGGPASGWHVLGYVVFLVLGALMIYSFLMVLATSSFTFINVEPIIELFEGVYQAGRWPIGVYPNWLRIGLTVVVPIGVAITIPAEVLVDRSSPSSLLWFTVLAAALFGLARLAWRMGVRRYSGASA